MRRFADVGRLSVIVRCVDDEAPPDDVNATVTRARSTLSRANALRADAVSDSLSATVDACGTAFATARMRVPDARAGPCQAFLTFSTNAEPLTRFGFVTVILPTVRRLGSGSLPAPR